MAIDSRQHANLSSFLSELTSLLPKHAVTTDPRELDRNAKDPSYHTPQRPYAVVSVSSEDEIVTTVKTCNKYAIPIIPSAGRTSLEGQVIPTSQIGITLDVSNMDKVIKINEDDSDCVVQPGIGWMELREKLEPYGLFFPPDPGAAACVGGMCGTNCSGTLAWRYGTMKDNVLSLRVVLANGTVIQTRRRATKSSAGYDLTRLFVGSEGTLGVISQITLRLRRIPQAMSVAMIQYRGLDEAALAVQNLVKAGIALHRMELMDTHAIRSVNLGRPTKDHFPERVTLLLEFAASSPETISQQITAVQSICSQAATHQSDFRFQIGTNREEAERLWIVRKTAYFAAKNLRPELGGRARIMTTDSAVPVSRIREILVRTREDLEGNGLTATILAHVGDGNFHVLLVIDSENPKELALAESFRVRNAALAISMDGTCTGEHGIGTGKIDLLKMELGEDAIELMRGIKGLVDPKGIMNPGKIFELRRDGEKAKL
ncbi:hypothetical protein HK097_009590 [Rhizophlyctis rosea]|uniref:D-lactate dehydrogenase (cytochrome) n=1 Tax=Rhizophlyctis rosea TaxID=64517 RepID=A0AAD5SAB1_9FUNG|nr:hypothetical protein HK097_009590 [Rhizophlyctis rosea]